ncbi:PREDICTED: flavonoid 3'-monooxygenase-like [Ipomoea nil]|uniref:flavonoid 3'-monooxygenase-like n=1 Tax=Ipomoea nil TaxID=35883 RepID=UPI000901DE20|nr:PREDICTED: flavonoid 3'-monooxygenase-like [Ipomoea nil]
MCIIKMASAEMEALLALFTFSLLLLSALWLYAKKSISKKAPPPPLPPGPRGFPVVGYLPFLRPNLHHHFTDLARKYGPIFKLQLGRRLVVVVNSPSLAKEVVRDHDAIFANRDPPIAGIIGTYGGRDIAFAPSGTYWREIRKVFVREMLSSANLRACYEHRREEVRKAIRSVKSRIGEPVNIRALASSTEINVITSMIWGSTLGCDEAKIDQIGAEFREIMGKFVAMIGEPNISDFFPWLARLDLQGVQARMEDMVKVVDNIFDPIINEGEKKVSEKSRSITKDDEKKDFLQILLELKNRDDNAGKSLDFQAIKAMLLDIVIGGTDTTATMVEWVMTTLLDNPEIMKKVQKELEEIVGMTSIVEEVHLPKLKYLDAVVKETFRLYPALPLLIPKCPSQTTQVGGYTIPKDTKVFLNMYAIHRDLKLWDNPLKFSPERFLNQTFGLDYTGNDHRFLPFGSGRRICVGIPLAEKMLIYILGSLLHSFNWHLPEGEKMDLSDGLGLVIKKNTPLVAVPAPRLPNSELYQ